MHRWWIYQTAHAQWHWSRLEREGHLRTSEQFASYVSCIANAKAYGLADDNQLIHAMPGPTDHLRERKA
jgi:hypothetical protein